MNAQDDTLLSDYLLEIIKGILWEKMLTL
jgi:hypothetical protein